LALYFVDHRDELVILDEIHRVPGLFENAARDDRSGQARKRPGR
jgi:hypothetical protein